MATDQQHSHKDHRSSVSGETIWTKGPCPLSQGKVKRETDVRKTMLVDIGQRQPSVGREGNNRVLWPVSEKAISMSVKPIYLWWIYGA